MIADSVCKERSDAEELKGAKNEDNRRSTEPSLAGAVAGLEGDAESSCCSSCLTLGQAGSGTLRRMNGGKKEWEVRKKSYYIEKQQKILHIFARGRRTEVVRITAHKLFETAFVRTELRVRPVWRIKYFIIHP